MLRAHRKQLINDKGSPTRHMNGGGKPDPNLHEDR